MMVLKAKITSKGTLDELNGRCVARGDIQDNLSKEDTWLGCVAVRTVRIFCNFPTKVKKRVKQLDFVGAYLQAQARGRLFVKLSQEYVKHFLEIQKKFNRPLRHNKTIYALTVSAKY